MKLVLQIGQVLYAFWLSFQKWRSAHRVSAVRTDPAFEWLRKFGGTDQRTDQRTDKPATPTDNTGGHSDG